MTVKDIVRMAAKTLQKNNLVNFIDGADAVNDEAKELENFVDCYNLVISELCEEYLPLKIAQTFNTADGTIRFTSFSKTPIEIIACFKNSEQIAFSQTPLSIKTKSGSVTVVYCYYPDRLELTDTNAYDNSKISSRIVALGVVREYLLFVGLYSEASIYDNKFRQAVSSVLLSKRNERMKARGWF